MFRPCWLCHSGCLPRDLLFWQNEFRGPRRSLSLPLLVDAARYHPRRRSVSVLIRLGFAPQGLRHIDRDKTSSDFGWFTREHRSGLVVERSIRTSARQLLFDDYGRGSLGSRHSLSRPGGRERRAGKTGGG